MDKSANFHKESIDSNAQAFWEKLFEGTQYAKMLTRKIPRRLKAALELEFAHKRKADKSDSFLQIKDLQVAPLAHAITKEALHLEGVFRGTYSDDSRLARVFHASLDKDGNLLSFRSLEAI